MSETITVAPVVGRARIEVLDVLRGLAILLIFYMNIGFQASSVTALFGDFRTIGWTAADRWTWIGIQTYLEGTQRGMLELLFGAGFMVLTARAMRPDGPVAIADLFMRRTLWLLVFGLLNIFVVLWVGDILTVYALASLFLFPFRLLGARLLLALGCLFALFTAVTGAFDYAERSALAARVEAAQAQQAAGAPLSADHKAALGAWQNKLDRFKPNAETNKALEQEREAYSGGWLPYAQYMWSAWTGFFIGKGILALSVIEAFCVMLIGIALWKWGVIQGRRSARFYAILLALTYGFGLTARYIGALEISSFAPYPKTIWMTAEFARIATSIGHVALVNLLFKAAAGRRILAPFKACGRTAFSLYFLQQIIGLHILFAPYGLGLWGRYGWATQFWIATAVIALCVLIANLWVLRFANGPLEWAWRSLSYVKRQPFLGRPDEGAPA